MPFGEDLPFLDRDISPPLVQSDLLGAAGSSSPANDWQDSNESRGPTVITVEDRVEANIQESAGIPEANMDLQAEDGAEARSSPSPPSSTTKKRGRPSLSASVTPAKSAASRTPRSNKSAATPRSAGRSTGKRKAAEAESKAEPKSEPEPGAERESEDEAEATPAPTRRGRPARTAGAAASARLAAKAARKPTRGRPKSTTISEKPAKRKGGRAKKAEDTNGEIPEGEYEVEKIVDSAIDAETMQHMYLVKWKNYPDSENTWEPRKNLKGALALVREFDAKKKKAEAEEAAKKAASGEEKKTTRVRKPKAVKQVKKAPGRPRRKRRARA